MSKAKLEILVSTFTKWGMWKLAKRAGLELDYGGKRPWRHVEDDEMLRQLLRATPALENLVEIATVSELADLCSGHGLVTSGSKDRLGDRLANYLANASPAKMKADQEGADDSADGGDDEESDSAEVEPEGDSPANRTQGLQGGPKHQRLQRLLVELGQIRGWHVRTNVSIGARCRPDVLWYRIDPEDRPDWGFCHVFEIEFGGAAEVSKSLTTLKHAHDKGCANLVLFVPEEGMRRIDSKVGQELRRGAFHEIKRSLTVLPIDHKCANHHSIAKLLKLDLL